MRRDSRGAEAVVKNGLHNRRSILNVVVDGKGEVWDRHAVMSIMLRVNAGVFLEIVHCLGKGTHEMIKDPSAFGCIEILCLDKVEFGKGCESGCHPSECGAAGFEAGFDVRPVVDGDFAGLVKCFATG